MSTRVTTRQGTGAYVPTSIGGPLEWQEPVSTVYVGGKVRIVITGTRSELVTTTGSVDVSDDVPATIREDHGASVAWWEGEVTRQEAERAHLARPDVFVTDDGRIVNAPGFDSLLHLTSFVERAKAAHLRTVPAKDPRSVLVQSVSSAAIYAVTRHACSCKAGMTHGRCYHRALVIWLHDVEGVPVCKLPTIGVNERGRTMTYGRKPAAKVVA
jgi:hypothetical protein